MSSMFFGQFLLEKGVINRDALLDAIERQRRANHSLTEVAVTEGLIDRGKADQINSLFRLSNQSIEVICAAEGGLSLNQIEQLRKKQRLGWLRIGTALVAGGHVTERQVEGLLEIYRAREAAERRTLEEDFDHLDDPIVARACTELTLSHLQRVTEIPIKLRSIERADGRLRDGWRRFAQDILGDHAFCIAIDLPMDLFSLVASKMLGVEVSPTSDAALDAGCELVNLIGGNTCTRLEPSGFRLRPEPPFSSGGLVSARPIRPSVRATAQAAEQELELNLFMKK
ncbi:MAG: hypothetical protein K8R59_12475 [Thermoanaerobaculales bacterium]|nr:hypothetical protein [Thermoanaerobaculales bacterium]